MKNHLPNYISDTLPRISFSQYNTFNSCPQLYNLSYINKPEKTETYRYDESSTAQGTYIQLLFETVVKKKLIYKYNSPKRKFYITNATLDKLKGELQIALKSTLEYKDKDVEEIPYRGLDLLEIETNSFYIDRNYTPQHLIKFSEKIINIFKENFELYSDLPWQNCTTEYPIDRSTDNFRLTGFCDFIFYDIEENTFIFLDGKLNKNLAHAEPDQLLFYVWGSNLSDLPIREIKVGFWNYTTKQQKLWDMVSTAKVESKINKFLASLSECKQSNHFNRTPEFFGDVSGHCKYCPEQHTCPAVQPHNRNIVSEIDIDSADISDFI